MVDLQNYHMAQQSATAQRTGNQSVKETAASSRDKKSVCQGDCCVLTCCSISPKTQRPRSPSVEEWIEKCDLYTNIAYDVH